eukprot:XP_016662833.1 PREDICTED: zinc finger protein 2-like isoform X2 [Acyrthosiphon pisum]
MEPRFFCPNNCGRSYKYKSSVVRHHEFECELQDKMDPSFVCPNHCGRSYKYKRSINRHLKFECGIQPKFKCLICNKKFTDKQSMKRHVILIHKYI